MHTGFLFAAGLACSVGSAVAFAEPMGEFDAIVGRCQEAYASRPMTEVAYADAVRSWVKRRFAPAGVTFQVRKTGSSVSPFVASIDITEIASAQRGDDEETVRALDVPADENVIRSRRSINFAYQDNQWTAIGGVSLLEVRRDASEPFSPAAGARLSREAVLALNGPIASCTAASRY